MHVCRVCRVYTFQLEQQSELSTIECISREVARKNARVMYHHRTRHVPQRDRRCGASASSKTFVGDTQISGVWLAGPRSASPGCTSSPRVRKYSNILESTPRARVEYASTVISLKRRCLGRSGRRRVAPPITVCITYVCTVQGIVEYRVYSIMLYTYICIYIHLHRLLCLGGLGSKRVCSM